MIKRTFNVGHVGCDDQPFADLLVLQAREFGQTVEREVQLGRITAHTDVIDPANEFGFKVSRAQQTKEGGFRIGVRNDRSCSDLLAVI